jgi:2-iminobutanoate/2-iminopropanoate deaminase
LVIDMREHVAFATADELASPGGHYSHAVRFGDLVFVSGQLGIRADGSHTAHLPFEHQVHQALENLLTALRSAGATAADVLKITAYIVYVERWPCFNALYADVMGNARPARTVVPVAQLHYGYLVEVDAIAVCSGDSRHQAPTMIDEDMRHRY